MGVRKSLIFLLLVSCSKENLCDLNYYPGPPYSNPDDIIYTENSVRYLYACMYENYNNVVYYKINNGCWDYTSELQFNINC